MRRRRFIHRKEEYEFEVLKHHYSRPQIKIFKLGRDKFSIINQDTIEAAIFEYILTMRSIWLSKNPYCYEHRFERMSWKRDKTQYGDRVNEHLSKEAYEDKVKKGRVSFCQQ
jgi:hypothetical protein